MSDPHTEQMLENQFLASEAALTEAHEAFQQFLARTPGREHDAQDLFLAGFQAGRFPRQSAPDELDDLDTTEPVSAHYTGADNQWHVTLWGDDVFTTTEPVQRDMFVAFLKIQLRFAGQMKVR